MTAESLRSWIQTQGYDFDEIKNYSALNNLEEEIKDFLENDGNRKGRTQKQMNQVRKAIGTIVDVDVIDEVDQRNADYIVITKRKISSANNVNELPDIDEKYKPDVVRKLKSLRGNRKSNIVRIERLGESFLETTSPEFIRRSKFRTVSSLANFYNLSKEDTINRLSELGFEVEGNNIIK